MALQSQGNRKMNTHTRKRRTKKRNGIFEVFVRSFQYVICIRMFTDIGKCFFRSALLFLCSFFSSFQRSQNALQRIYYTYFSHTFFWTPWPVWSFQVNRCRWRILLYISFSSDDWVMMLNAVCVAYITLFVFCRRCHRHHQKKNCTTATNNKNN